MMLAEDLSPSALEAVMNLRAAENFRYLGIGLRYRD
jgi:hypothetical protein